MLWRLSSPSYSSFFNFFFLGLGRSCKDYSSVASSDHLRIGNIDAPAEVDSAGSYDEIEKIRQEFDVAKQSFLKIPEVLKLMPKMDPEGWSN